jgi:hypothetical protein
MKLPVSIGFLVKAGKTVVQVQVLVFETGTN